MGHKDERSKPEDRFKQEDFPDFIPGKFVHGKFYPINVDEHLSLDVFLEQISLERQNKSAHTRMDKDLKNRSARNCSLDSSLQSIYNYTDEPVLIDHLSTNTY